MLCTLPQVAFVYLCYKYIPESPRWLLINGRFTAAEAIIKRGAYLNGHQAPVETNGDVVAADDANDANVKLTSIKTDGDPNELPDNLEVSIKKLVNKFEDELNLQKRSVTLIDLWLSPNLRKKTLILYFTWAVNGFVYYGLSFNTNSLGGNIYLNFFLMGLVEIPAYLLTIKILRDYGRRIPLAIAMAGAGVAFLVSLPVASFESLSWLSTVFALAGKFCITSSFAIIYLVSDFFEAQILILTCKTIQVCLIEQLEKFTFSHISTNFVLQTNRNFSSLFILSSQSIIEIKHTLLKLLRNLSHSILVRFIQQLLVQLALARVRWQQDLVLSQHRTLKSLVKPLT